MPPCCKTLTDPPPFFHTHPPTHPPAPHAPPAQKQGHFPSDSALLDDPEFRKYAELYAADQSGFFKDLAASYTKMGLQGVNIA